MKKLLLKIIVLFISLLFADASYSQLSVTATIANSISCNGGNNGSATANPSGGTPPYTYSWNSSGQTTQTATGLSAGTYTVTVTDAASITAIAMVTISQPNALSLSTAYTSPTTGNNGTATVNVSGGAPPYSYEWVPSGQTTQTATGLGAGVYTVTVYDENGCSNTQSIVITYNPTIVIEEDLFSVNSIFPNPAKNNITIETDLPAGQAGETKNFIVRITNPLGQKVSEKKFLKKTEVDVSGYGKGLFLVEVCLPAGQAGDEKWTRCRTEKVLIE